MAEEHAADTRFDRLLALTQDAFTDRHYPTAYYTWVAAMCEAEATQDVPRLLLVQTSAEEYAAPGERPVAALPPLTYRRLSRRKREIFGGRPQLPVYKGVADA